MAAEKQDIDVLRKRYVDLDRKRAAAQANLATATTQLEELKRQAREQFGTDDLPSLKSQLEQIKADNEQRRSEYQAHLDQITEDLAEVEKKHSGEAGDE